MLSSSTVPAPFQSSGSRQLPTRKSAWPSTVWSGTFHDKESSILLVWGPTCEQAISNEGKQMGGEGDSSVCNGYTDSVSSVPLLKTRIILTNASWFAWKVPFSLWDLPVLFFFHTHSVTVPSTHSMMMCTHVNCNPYFFMETCISQVMKSF